MRKFENCDIFSVLGTIVAHNTKHYQADFDIDKDILTEAAEEHSVFFRTMKRMRKVLNSARKTMNSPISRKMTPTTIPKKFFRNSILTAPPIFTDTAFR